VIPEMYEQHRIPKFFIAAFLLIALSRVSPQIRHGSDTSRFGEVSFPTSCSIVVQKQFDLGVSLLHSFEYDQASRQFREVLQQDRGCAMAYWGEAMSLNHPLWPQSSDTYLVDGWQLVQKAESQRKKSPREEAYIRAISTFYKPGKQDIEERNVAYSREMEKLHKAYPSDEEASVFYSLSLIAIQPPNDPSFAYAKQATSILNHVLAKHPNHPGAMHYLIHACDNPGMAGAGLAVARRYASIAPSSPHALHMPSHIFARLGMWQEDIASNLASLAAAKRAASGTESRLHAMDFLEYAYLQTAQDSEAKAIEGEAVALKNEGFTRGMELYYYYSQSHFPALLLLETKNWKAAESLQPAPNADRGSKAIIYRARAIGAGHIGDVIMAREAVRNLDEALPFIEESHPELMVPPVDANKNEAHAWLAFAEGNSSAAFDLLQQVIQFQDHVGKGEAELPAREMYADMLLALGRPVEALEQYRLTLKSDPNRFNSLYGAGLSAELAHQTSVATACYKQLLRNCNQGRNSNRKELQHARRAIAAMANSPTP